MQNAVFARLYSDAHGESHFYDKAVELHPMDFAPPTSPVNVATLGGASQCGFVGALPNWAGDVPHPTPHRRFVCVLAGEVEVTASDGAVRRFPRGALLVQEDTSGKGHATRVGG